MKHQTVVIDDEPMLLGETTQDQLFFDFPKWKNVYNSYIPKKDVVEKLKSISGPLRVEVFFGTWCSDSRRDVPAFLKIINSDKTLSSMPYKLFAVDRSKHTPDGLAVKRGIERVATFIFYKNETEIGRIVEFPDDTIEEDMAFILGGH